MSNGGYQGFRMSDRWMDGWMVVVVVVVLHVRNEVPLLRTLFSISHWLLFTISFTTQSPLLMTLGKMLFENIVEKGENTVDQHFPLFRTMFSTFSTTNFTFSDMFILLSTNAFKLEWSKLLLFGKNLLQSKISVSKECH